MPKIAFPSDDGVTISAHLGRARLFVVAEYEGKTVARFEQRSKSQHGTGPQPGGIQLMGESAGQHGGHHHENHEGSDSHSGPGGMLSPVGDCQVLIAGGMGQPAYDGALRLGLSVVLTGERRIGEALAAYRAGQLESDMRRVHAH